MSDRPDPFEQLVAALEASSREHMRALDEIDGRVAEDMRRREENGGAER